MAALVGEYLRPFERAHGIGDEIRAGHVQMLGTSGTVTTLAGIHLDLPRYQRSIVDGQMLSFEVVSAVSERLRAMCYSERAAEPCVGPDRADLVVAGCAILAAIIGMWPVGRLRVADRGVREGILFSLMAADRAAGTHW
jgi:exopolyphosphatase/guanosine-5'-triphosphate,3'-diphosphate pyrophosphatase